MLAWLYWNPCKEVLTIPFIDHPIAWYGVFFALGFLGSYYLFKAIAKKYYTFDPYFVLADIKNTQMFLTLCQNARQEPIVHDFLHSLPEPLREKIFTCNPYEPVEEGFFKSLFFGLNHFLEQKGDRKKETRESLENFFLGCMQPLKDKIQLLADKVFLYGVIGTVVGARLGHILFYENLSYFIENPLSIFKTWEGGLASHGGLAGILLMLGVFSRKYKGLFPKINFLRLCDFLALEIPFAAVFIRIGNFFNQEILGVRTQVPWAVIFGSPADGSLAYPRHPAQLYEAVCYLFLFFVILKLKNYKQILMKPGRLFAIFCITASCLRFMIEFIKENQSVYDGSFLNMGQLLTHPFFLFGVALLLLDLAFKQRAFVFKYSKK